MTNEEILKTSKSLLTAIDRQRRFLLELAMLKSPCPMCGVALDQFEAAGIAINDYTFGIERPAFRCRNSACGIELNKVVPFFAGPAWLWIVKR